MNAVVVETLITFSIVLILTKAKVLGWKREFVKVRYESAKIGGNDPGWIHRWWYSIWHCEMCCGFWVAAVVCFQLNLNWLSETLVVFGLNWLLHSVENLLFYAGKNLEEKFSQKD